MQKKDIHIVSTRALSDDLIFSAKLSNIAINCHDFLQITHRDVKDFQKYVLSNTSPFIFTSIHAVESIKSLLPILKTKDCFAIEGNTSKLALLLGFSVLDKADDSIKLAQRIKESQINAVMHCSTRIRRDDLKNILLENNINYQVVEVYDKKFSPYVVYNYDGVMFFSPTQIDSFLIKNKLDSNTPAFCIGETTAKHLFTKNHQNIIKSSKHNASELLNTVINYYKIQK